MPGALAAASGTIVPPPHSQGAALESLVQVLPILPTTAQAARIESLRRIGEQPLGLFTAVRATTDRDCPHPALPAPADRLKREGEERVNYRDMMPGEEQAVLDVVMRGFDEFVRPDFTELGVAEFTVSVRTFILDWPDGHHIMVAEENGLIAGMIDVRDTTHVSLFFVEPAHHGQGVGHALIDFAFSDHVGPVTVNSSPWAVPIYEHLGFVVTGPGMERNGVRAVPMVRQPG